MNLTTQYPILSGETKKDINTLYNWSVELLDELKPLLLKLDASNVSEAASVKAQNIDTDTARICDAQIKSLTADKLTAGTIDAREIRVKNINADEINTGTLTINDNMAIENEKGTLKIDSEKIVMLDDDKNERIRLGSDGEGYMMSVMNPDASEGLYMTDEGDIYFTGTLNSGNDAKIGNNLILKGNKWSAISWVDENDREICALSFDPGGRTLTFTAANVYFNGNVYDKNNNPIKGEVQSEK